MKIKSEAFRKLKNAIGGRLHSFVMPKCADCGDKIGFDEGPKDGWQLEDGRTVCHTCCVKDTKIMMGKIIRKA